MTTAMATPDPCSICFGACCESMLFSYPSGMPIMDEFYERRGTVHAAEGVVELETRCTKLCLNGACGIYKDRPRVCRDYKVGSEMCLRTIRIRRPGAQGEAILSAIKALSKDA